MTVRNKYWYWQTSNCDKKIKTCVLQVPWHCYFQSDLPITEFLNCFIWFPWKRTWWFRLKELCVAPSAHLSMCIHKLEKWPISKSIAKKVSKYVHQFHTYQQRHETCSFSR
jgi:hypothetical protein